MKLIGIGYVLGDDYRCAIDTLSEMILLWSREGGWPMEPNNSSFGEHKEPTNSDGTAQERLLPSNVEWCQ